MAYNDDINVNHWNWMNDRTDENTRRALFVLKSTLKLFRNTTNAGLSKANQIAATEEAANVYRVFEEIETTMKNKTYLNVEIGKENLDKLIIINEFLRRVFKKYPNRQVQMTFMCLNYLTLLLGKIYNEGVRAAMYKREAAAAGGSGDESPKTPPPAMGGARKTRKQKRRNRHTSKKSKKTRRY